MMRSIAIAFMIGGTSSGGSSVAGLPGETPARLAPIRVRTRAVAGRMGEMLRRSLVNPRREAGGRTANVERPLEIDGVMLAESVSQTAHLRQR